MTGRAMAQVTLLVLVSSQQQKAERIGCGRLVPYLKAEVFFLDALWARELPAQQDCMLMACSL